MAGIIFFKVDGNWAIIFLTRFYGWVYWLLKAQSYSTVQECDARGDAIKNSAWLIIFFVTVK